MFYFYEVRFYDKMKGVTDDTSMFVYLQIQNDYKVINMDQWMGFFRFCNEVVFSVPKFSSMVIEFHLLLL